MVKVGSDFSGVGAFDQALMRLGIDYKKVFACDWDKYARQTYIHNYGYPDYFPMDVYDREIPTDPLDIYMTSPPCQAFSLAGKRKGEDDKRGILFYNSHEFIKVNKPRYFIFENVKGLLSDSGGATFGKWIQYLGGKSVNGNNTIFPHNDSVPYHVYWKVLNAKDYGIPQNRERVFIVGIRDDSDNCFSWPREQHLEKRLRDILEPEVDEKYYLSDRIIAGFTNKTNGFKERFTPTDGDVVGNCITASCYKTAITDNFIQVKSATTKGYELAEIGEDSINFEQPNSETRRGRVGKGVAQTITTGCQQGVVIGGAIRGRNPKNPSDRTTGQKDNVAVIKHQRTEEAKAKRRESLSKGKDSGNFADREMILVEQQYSDTILANMNPKKEGLIAVNEVVQFNQDPPTFDGYRIRRLTPRECFRLMDFPDSFTWPVSDSQAYKQAGNSICVGVLAAIIGRLKL